MTSNFGDTTQALLRVKSILLNTYVNKEEKLETNYQSIHLKMCKKKNTANLSSLHPYKQKERNNREKTSLNRKQS